MWLHNLGSSKVYGKACANIWKRKGTHGREKKKENESVMLSGCLKVLKFKQNFTLCRKRIAKENYLFCKVITSCKNVWVSLIHLNCSPFLFRIRWPLPLLRNCWRGSKSFHVCDIPFFPLLCYTGTASGDENVLAECHRCSWSWKSHCDLWGWWLLSLQKFKLYKCSLESESIKDKKDHSNF